MKYAIFIPAYNEEKNITGIIKGSLNFVKDILVVDDGSRDLTSKVAKEAGARVFRHDKNMGKGAALISGFSEIMKGNFDAVITIDADGQHLPAEIPSLMAAFESGKGDIIIGERTINREIMPFYRFVANKVGEFFIPMAIGTRLRDTQSGFRIYSREVIEKVSIKTSGFEMETEILLKAQRAGFRIGTVAVTAVYPDNYSSHFRPVRDFCRISLLFLKHIFKKA